MSSYDEEFTGDVPDDVEAALHRQDEAMALLERLRAEEPSVPRKTTLGGGRRDFRRWPTPPEIMVEMHDGLRWVKLHCVDMAVGGAKVEHFAPDVEGPFPVRLRAPGTNATLVLCDIMWRDGKDKVGVRFEFYSDEERENWSGALIDALLAHHALN